MRKRLYVFVARMAVVLVIGALLIGMSLNAALADEGTGAGDNATTAGAHDKVVVALAVAAVTIGASWSAAFAVAKVGSAAMGAVSENPELMGRSLVFVGLAEGIAIYGLIIAIMLLQQM